ncbi:hypothetical protein B0H66DRAFT_603200 [Apodospora peruviana]|uniref:Uncharacterized protein n=1 Tax=Apodospora peruviana TaxID=516989 RepID=A0AAE0I4V8_9PEZI|nr:hypothetical protein B0H66DRAFT_603200 [Apodospora peruviana]
MGGVRQPFIYEAVQHDDGRFQSTKFDPKAVTRASWEAKPPKPKQDGPLVSFGRHPDAHMAPSQRSKGFTPMGRRTKNWIVYMRFVQLACRVLELVAAVGLSILMILLDKVEVLAGWVLRITLGVTILHCIYATYHLSRPAGGRTPGSSAAYHVFAGVSDLAILPLFAYGALTARNNGETWGTLLHNETLTAAYFVPAVYYGLISAGGLHLLSLSISLWLSVMFRRIVMMPPDMNPLESRFTSRAHKRNKSSVATSTYSDGKKRLDTPLDGPRRFVYSQADLSRPPSIPFMHTRQGSQTSLGTRDSRLDLPSRQYQINPGNSPRNSATSQDLKRMSAPPRTSNRNSYTEVPLKDTNASNSRPTSSYSRPVSSYSRPESSRPSSGTVAHFPEQVSVTHTAQPRAAKFTEAWYASESLVNRTQERNRAVNQMNAASKRRAYEALNQSYDLPDSDSENDENSLRKSNLAPGKDESNSEGDLGGLGTSSRHPNPLRSNPTASPPPPTNCQPYTAYKPALSEVNLNDRRVSDGQDIADDNTASNGGGGDSKWERNRDSSIQPENLFYSKPYGQLKPGTPPVMLPGKNRQVSSGNDYDLGSVSMGFARRNVSGKIAEEGRADGGQNRYSRYSTLNE